MSDAAREDLRRLIVLAYYFPPMGLSGVQRVAKFCKYLPEYGWQPVVVTARTGSYFAFDEGLLDEVEAAGVEIHRTGSLDPTRLFGRGAQQVALPDERSRRLFDSLTQWLCVPDNKIGWLPPALLKARQLLRDRPFHAILSSAPPYTSHLIGALLSRWSGLPLLVDFRDDWVGNPRHRYPTHLHRRAHEWLERKVLAVAHGATTINDYIRRDLEGRHPGQRVGLDVVPQGYDAVDFSCPSRPPGNRMRWLYTGVFYDAQQPDTFLRGLARFLDHESGARDHVEAVFAGLLPQRARRLVATLGLDDVVHYRGYLEHDAVVCEMEQADILWMTVGRQSGEHQISTGKLFEYVGSRRPILGLVPPGAAADALARYGASTVVDPDDVAGVAEAMDRLYQQWEVGTLPEPDVQFVEQHDRRHLTALLARRLDGLLIASA